MRAAVAVAVTAGVVLLVAATVTGPAHYFGRTNIRVHRSYPTPTTPSGTPRGRPVGPQPLPRVHHRLDLSWIGTLLSWLVLLLLVAAVVAAVVWVVRHRPVRDRSKPPAFDVLPDVEATRALENDSEAQLARLMEGSPRNGIVACWLRVEESVAAAGVPTTPAETSTELTVRVLHQLDLDPHAVALLAALYREARFSEHPMGESARQAARQALGSIQADLRASVSSAGHGGGVHA